MAEAFVYQRGHARPRFVPVDRRENVHWVQERL